MKEEQIGFSQTWEDPRIDAKALSINKDDRVIAISSAGCTPLSLLLDEPAEVVSLDSNAVQNYLCELKIAAIKTLEPSDLLAFMGEKPSDRRWTTYNQLRQELSSEACSFWDANCEAIEDGIQWMGVADRYFRRVGSFFCRWIYGQEVVAKLFRLESIEEQENFFQKHINNLSTRILRAILAPFYLSPFALRVLFPRGFFRYITVGDMAGKIKKRFEHVITKVPIADNYFLSRIYLGHHLNVRGGAPPYLEKLQQAKQRLSALQLVTMPVERYLQSLPNCSIDCFQLSNVVEWMDELERCSFFDQLHRVARPGARLFLRNAFTNNVIPEKVLSGFKHDEALSNELLEQDRSFIYHRCYAATVVKS